MNSFNLNRFLFNFALYTFMSIRTKNLPVKGGPIMVAISSQAKGLRSARLYIFAFASHRSGLFSTSSTKRDSISFEKNCDLGGMFQMKKKYDNRHDLQ